MPTTYISPTGSGDHSGSSWANAASIKSLDSMVKKAGDGGTVLLAADKGTYNVSSPISVTGAGVTVKGVNSDGSAGMATFEGTRDHNWSSGKTSGTEFFRIQKGADNLSFQNMQMNDTGSAIRVAGDVKNLDIENIKASNVQRFLEDYASGSNKTATISGLHVKDVDVEGFSKDAIRLKYDTNNVKIESVKGDSQGQLGDNFAMGVHLEGTVHDVAFDHVTMSNSTTVASSKNYWNGDGFATERGTYNISFTDTLAAGNTDGGYDIKSDNVTLTRAVAEDNGRNFRIWGSNVTISDSLGLDPHKRGGITSQSQVWIASTAKNVTIEHSSFRDSGSGTKAIVNEGGGLTIIDTQLTIGSGATAFVGKATGSSSATVTVTPSNGIYTALGANTDNLKATAAISNSIVSEHATPAIAAKIGVAIAPSFTPSNAEPAKIEITSAHEKVVATSKAEMFIFDLEHRTGRDTITGFGSNDTIAVSHMLDDANQDGMIAFGKNGILDLSPGSTVSGVGTLKSLRYVGHTHDGYLYADAKIRPEGAIEAKLGASSTLSGDKHDVAINKFFFDTALDVSFGSAKITNVGQKDVIVTTEKIGSTQVVHSGGDGTFALSHDGIDLGSLSLTDTHGHAVGSLSYEGEKIVGGTHYYLYGDTTPHAVAHDIG